MLAPVWTSLGWLTFIVSRFLVRQEPSMTVESNMVSVCAWQRSGKPVPAAAFVDKVAIAPDDPVSKHKGPGHARVDLVSKTLDDFEDSDEPITDFVAHCNAKLLEFVRWLTKQSPAVFQDLRNMGCVTNMSIFVVANSTKEAIHLDLPPEFMVECGRLGLALTITVSLSEE
jgi:hypothetical protein